MFHVLRAFHTPSNPRTHKKPIIVQKSDVLHETLLQKTDDQKVIWFDGAVVLCIVQVQALHSHTKLSFPSIIHNNNNVYKGTLCAFATNFYDFISNRAFVFALCDSRKTTTSVNALRFAVAAMHAKHLKYKYFYLFSFGFIMKYFLVATPLVFQCSVSSRHWIHRSRLLAAVVLIFHMENGLQFSVCKMQELRKILNWRSDVQKLTHAPRRI